MYIYILSSTDRLFRCITTLQYSSTSGMLPAEIETRLNLYELYILPNSHQHSQRKRRNILRTSFFLHRLLRRAMHFSVRGSRQIPHSSA